MRTLRLDALHLLGAVPLMDGFTKLLALLMLLLIAAFNTVALYWFTFGLWPAHYWPLPACAVVSALLQTAATGLRGLK